VKERSAANGRRLGEILAEIARRPEPELRLGELVDGMGDRSHGLLIAALALPNVLPVYLPGLSAVFGLPLVFVAAQLAVGRKALWLPPFLARRAVRRAHFARMALALAPRLARLERALKPRRPELAGPAIERLAGLLAILLGILLSLPIPFTNIPLSVPLIVLGLALAERDGIMVTAGLALGAAVAAAVLALSGALVLAALDWLAGLL